MDVSIVIVSFNAAPYLKNCLDSILKYTDGIDYEVIVVENKSTDDSPQVLKDAVKAHPTKIKAVFAEENGGFAKGNNLGIRQTKGKYILLLNPDTLLIENTPKKMFDWMETHSDVAVASGQMLDSDKKISPTGGYFPGLRRVAAWALFIDDLPVIRNYILSYHPHPGRVYGKEFFPDWVTGAFFMIRRQAMEKVGVFDSNMFMYGEELEWCIRFKQAGWKVGYTPTTRIYHFERKSSGGLPRNAVLGEFKGLKYIYGKYYPGWKQWALDTFLDVAATLRIFLWLFRFKPEMVKIYLEALFL